MNEENVNDAYSLFLEKMIQIYLARLPLRTFKSCKKNKKGMGYTVSLRNDKKKNRLLQKFLRTRIPETLE